MYDSARLRVTNEIPDQVALSIRVWAENTRNDHDPSMRIDLVGIAFHVTEGPTVFSQRSHHRPHPHPHTLMKFPQYLRHPPCFFRELFQIEKSSSEERHRSQVHVSSVFSISETVRGWKSRISRKSYGILDLSLGHIPSMFSIFDSFEVAL